MLSKASPLLKGALVSNKSEVLSYLSSTKKPPRSESVGLSWDSAVSNLLALAAGNHEAGRNGNATAHLAREERIQMSNEWREPVQLYNLKA